MNRTGLYLGIILGVLFLIIGYVYATHAANALPSYFPGYDAALTTKHAKHAIGAILLGLGCFVYAWFQTGPKKTGN